MDFGKRPKHENPRKGANSLSQLLFVWIIPLLWRGMKNGLTTDDLTKCLRQDKSDTLGDNLEREWNLELAAAMKRKRKPQLWKPMFRLYAAQFFIDGALQCLYILIRCLIPLVFAQFLIQFQGQIVHVNVDTQQLDAFNVSNRTEATESLSDISQRSQSIEKVYSLAQYAWNDVHWLACLLISMSFVGIFCVQHGRIRLILLGARLKIACCSLIYRKSLRLSASAASQTGNGYIVNLMSNDVSRFDFLLCYVNYIWILPLQSVLIGYLLWQRVRWAAVVGVVGLLLKTVPVQTLFGHYTMLLRKKIAERTDKRIGIMNEIIQSIEVIKMYAWEIPFHKLVAECRRSEVEQIQKASIIKGFTLSLQAIVAWSTLFISIATCILTGQSITAHIVFSMAQYLQILRLNAATLYPLGLSFGAEAIMSTRRIEEFLLKDEKNERSDGVQRRSSFILTNENENAIEINGLYASWDRNSDIATLNQIDLKIKPGQICAIVGPVGGGKSSLIQLLLGELPAKSGSVIVNGSISYAAQDPWIFFGTIRENILFGQAYDKKRYDKTVKCCALTTDFEQLPFGDRTVIGDRGASLSGGQRARISLARAMYKTASIYLLDDPLSAVDTHVGKHLFDEVIGPKARIAKNATRVLVTHQINFLKEADVIVVMENGKITHRGSYAELSNSDIDFAKLLRKIDEEDENRGSISDILANDVQVYENDDNIPYIDDVSNDSSYKALRRSSKLSSKLSSRSSIVSREFDSSPVEGEEQTQNGIPWTAFSQYFMAGSNRCGISLIVLIMILAQLITSGTNYFVKYWTHQEFKREHGGNVLFTQIDYLYMLGGCTLCIIFISAVRSTLFLTLCMRASKVLHDQMFNSILHAPISFFNLNPGSMGRILNRFSNDIGSIDESLPNTMMDAVQTMFDIFGIIILVIIVNRAMITVFLAATLLCGLILKLYLRSSQDLKRLEGISRGPILSHLTASMNGLATIRSRNIQTELCQEFDELQNVHSSVWQLTLTSIQAFGFWIDCVCAAFVTCVTLSFLVSYDNTFSGNVGLAISQALDLTGLVQFSMRQITETMQQMTNVERVVQYMDLEPERSPVQKAPDNWPNSGKIVVKDLYLRYNRNDVPTLKNFHVEIPAGFKIGVVGRTGAGKSSLIAALFRLAHIEGTIEIDGVDTGTISLESLRSKISIIPQNPVLFSGSVRYNLDPFGCYSDDQMWRALKSVELKSMIKSLDYPVTEGGHNFSVGQRQLLCLARAISRKNRILVLDEATANVDAQTDQLIQRTIRRQFADCTVLTVAHRLHTIIDSDRVLVMDAGNVVEYDQPFKLLQTNDGIFRGMIEALGPNEYERLCIFAKEKFKTDKDDFLQKQI